MADDDAPKPLVDAVGLRLLATRLALSEVEGVTFTQDMLANVIGVTRPALANWEQRKRLPSMAAMIRLSQRFPVTLDWLYQGKLFGMPFNLQQALERWAAEVGAPVGTATAEFPMASEQAAIAARGRAGGLALARARRSKRTLHERPRSHPDD